MLGFDGKYPARKCNKSAVKHSIEKLILHDFVDVSLTFCPRLSEKNFFISNLVQAP